jgi:hypothetical protein
MKEKRVGAKALILMQHQILLMKAEFLMDKCICMLLILEVGLDSLRTKGELQSVTVRERIPHIPRELLRRHHNIWVNLKNVY